MSVTKDFAAAPDAALGAALVEAFDAGQRAAQADTAALVEALEQIKNMDNIDSAKLTARAALKAYRKQGGES